MLITMHARKNTNLGFVFARAVFFLQTIIFFLSVPFFKMHMGVGLIGAGISSDDCSAVTLVYESRKSLSTHKVKCKLSTITLEAYLHYIQLLLCNIFDGIHHTTGNTFDGVLFITYEQSHLLFLKLFNLLFCTLYFMCQHTVF